MDFRHKKYNCRNEIHTFEINNRTIKFLAKITIYENFNSGQNILTVGMSFEMIERIDEESLIPHSRNISTRFTTRNDFKHLINQLSRNAFLEINDSTLNREFRQALRNSSMNIQPIYRSK